MRKILRILILVAALLPSPGGEGAAYRNSVAADEVAQSSKLCYTATVFKIYDGDTIIVQDEEGEKHRIRFYGIDAPELKQEGGQESLQNLTAHLANAAKVRIEVQNIDLYGREVALIYVGSVNINRQQVVEGYAWHYKQYDRLFKKEFAALEQQARNKQIGIWKNPNLQPPWEFRKRKNPGMTDNVRHPWVFS